MHRIGRWFAVVAVALLAATPAGAQDKVRVVASFSIIADLVKQVGGDHVDVATLAPANVDMHVFQPKPSDAKRVKDAQLVVVNGLGLEGWADRLVASSGTRAVKLVASKGVTPLREKAQGGHGHGHAHDDPHAWQSVANVKLYVANIRDALTGVDAAHKADYESRAADFTKRLDALEGEIRDAFKDIARPRRVITSHEAFSYYGKAYDIEFLAPQGVTGEAQPSAGRVAQLIRQIKREKVPAVFIENIGEQKLMDQIAREGGAVVGGTLYSDALSPPSGPATTYIDMMRHNTRLIAAGLRGQKL
jgi:zinc/manganese transport system substrate-binding protein